MGTRILIAIALLASPAFAADPEHKQTPQQSRMAACAHETKGMKTDERHHFMSECLKGHASTAGDAAKEVTARSDTGAQEERMKACNVEAAKKDLHGDERRAWLGACLKG
jgi:hypothetical protein